MNSTFFFVAMTTAGLFIAAAWAVLTRPRENSVHTRLQEWVSWEKQQDAIVLTPRHTPRRSVVVDSVAHPTFLSKLSRTLIQVNSPYNVTTFFLFSFLFGVGSGALVWVLTPNWLQIVLVALIAGFTPYAVLMYNKRQYLRQLESQLPQALDMLAQSLRAGHTIQAGIRTIGDDFDEPICSEFRRTSEAIELGMPLTIALEDLALYVEIADLRFFVTSVLIQRETGGNLTEIIARTAELIRKRLEFNDRIRALSAEGQLSAYILFFIPVALALYFHFADPAHFEAILKWQWGITTLIITGIWMIIGMVFIKQMSKIDV